MTRFGPGARVAALAFIVRGAAIVAIGFGRPVVLFVAVAVLTFAITEGGACRWTGWD